MNIIIFLLIGAVAGYLAGLVMKGRGFGVLVNIIVGLAGSFISGYFIFPLLGLSSSGLIGSIIAATVGAILLLFVIGLIKKK